MELFQDIPGYVWVLTAVFMGLGLFLTILWIIVPFSIFGVKPLVKDMLNKLELLEEHLNRLAADAGPGKGNNTTTKTQVMAGDEEQPPPMPM